MDLFGHEWWIELGIQLLIAILTTVLGMLTYDRAVARPRLRRLSERWRRRLDRPF